jgi:hypothetical protein
MVTRALPPGLGRSCINLFCSLLFWCSICPIAFIGLCTTALADGKGYVEVKTIPLYDTMKTSLKWRATAYEWGEKNDRQFEQPAAKICFWQDPAKKGRMCFLAEDQGVRYQSVEEVSLIELDKKNGAEYGVLFVARDLSPSIGKVRLFTIWVYSKKGPNFVNALPSIRLSDVSEYRILAQTNKGPHGIFVTADRIWNTGEGPLYGGEHHFQIEVYKYLRPRSFQLLGKYVTDRKYLTVDILDDYGVIKSEQQTIESLVLKK